jgi:MFS family permease
LTGSETTPGRATTLNARAFYLVYVSSSISWFGTAVTTVALPLVAVLLLDASTLEVSIISAASVAAWLIIGLPSGVIVSKFPLRASLVTAQVARGLILLSVPIAATLDILTVAHLVVVATLIGIFSVLYDVAFASFMPSVVPAEDLTRRNSMVQGTESIALMVGPAGGGFLVQLVGAAASLIADVVSYAISAACLFALGKPPEGTRVEPAGEEGGFVEQMRVGLRYVRRDEIVGPLTAAAAALNFTNAAATALSTVFLARTLDLSPLAIGLLLAFEGVGAVSGAAVATPLVNRIGSGRTVLLTMVVAPASALLLPLAYPGPAVVFWALGYGGLAGATVAFSIVARTHRQVSVPPVLLPRVMATVRFLSWGVLPLGAVIAGVLGEILGVRPALAILCATLLIGLVPVLRSPVRWRRDLMDPATSP